MSIFVLLRNIYGIFYLFTSLEEDTDIFLVVENVGGILLQLKVLKTLLVG
jgi:hypothetical protein